MSDAIIKKNEASRKKRGMPTFDDIKDLELFNKLLKREEKRLERRRKRKANWEDPEQKQLYVKELKQQRRQLLLDKLCPKRICPCCEETKVYTKQWCVIDIRQKLKGQRSAMAVKLRAAGVYLEHKADRHKKRTYWAALCRGCAQSSLRDELWNGKREPGSKKPTKLVPLTDEQKQELKDEVYDAG